MKKFSFGGSAARGKVYCIEELDVRMVLENGKKVILLYDTKLAKLWPEYYIAKIILYPLKQG